MDASRSPEEVDRLVEEIFARESKKTHHLTPEEIEEMKAKIKKLALIDPIPNQGDNWDLP